MRSLLVVFISLLALAACSPVSTYHRQDVTRAQLQDDLLNCEVEALADAPVATQIRRSAPRYYPGFRRCTSDGRCYRTGGYFIPGETYTVDANARLRQNLRSRCMSLLGYSAVELPRCTSPTPAMTTTDKLPELSDTSCVVRDTNGLFQITDTAG